MMILLQIFAFFALLILKVSSSGYIKDQISVKMATVSSNCVRLLNGTNTVGCQSNMKGNIGALVKIVEPKDVEEAIQKLPLGINDLIVLVETLDLSRELIDVIRTNEQVQGVILLDDKLKKPNKFSEDSSCPNQQFSAYKNDKTCHEWNAPGAIHPDGLRFLSFDKPIRFVYNQTEIELLVKKCANPYNKELKADGFRCVGRMTTFMLAAGNAQICKNRGESLYGLIESRTLCEPLSELNVFAMLPPLGQRSNKTVRADQFVLAAKMDTFSMDYNSGNGDISILTSIIALLSIANAIGAKMDEFLSLAKQRQLLFAFFHGESLGYIGSGRWLWDMEEGNFPHPPIKLPEEQVRQIGLDALSFFLEFQQIGTSEKLFLHTDKSIYASNRTQIDEILETLKNQVEFINPSKLEYGSMPPGSYHSILSRTSHVPGMLLSSFGEGKYTNNYVNSIYDTEIRWGNSTFYKSYVQRIKKAADVGLIAALSYVFNTTNQTLINQFKIKKEYVEELADCFFRYSRWECPLIMGVVNATNDAKVRNWLKYTANDLYIGTAGHHYSSIRVVLHSLLVNSLGQTGPTVNVANAQQCKDQNKKQNVYTYIWQNEPDTNTSKCYRTSIYPGQAQSPAFKIENYDFTNSTYPTWMESIQSGGSLELYFKADYHLELYAVLIALLIILISAPLNFGLKEQWFIDNTLPPASPQPL